ncbi:succinate dehydrogenase cytochrome b subunit [Streptomyces sp. NPDC006879]|uniref:succinate dehydrogenase cytochrome b subunit n=1 Tax=Streptomyces sp. NPDC006879 TaxID=3364767 RepID=UPI00368DBA87
MDLATRRGPRPSVLGTLWKSTIGKKVVMAVSGLIMLGYLVVHMLGNLKIFFGPAEFNGYARWLRSLGEPVLHHEWALWIFRVVLLAAVLLHGACAYQLSRRDLGARPVAYARRRHRDSYAARTMRWGGVIIGLFLVWHLLDLTTLTVNERAWAGHPYENVLATFSTWYGNVIYLTAVIALGFHVRHGLWSATQTLGLGSAARDRALRALANTLAVLLTLGFAAAPVAVMTEVVK